MPSENNCALPVAYYQGHTNWDPLLIIQFKPVDQYAETNNYKHLLIDCASDAIRN